MSALIEIKKSRSTHHFECERVEQGTAINPVLPDDFEETDNLRRPMRHRAWWRVPFIVTRKSDHPDFLRLYPEGVCYELRCLNGGAWDRSTWCGQFASLDEALSQVPNANIEHGQPARDRSWELEDQRKQAGASAAPVEQ